MTDVRETEEEKEREAKKTKKKKKTKDENCNFFGFFYLINSKKQTNLNF